MREARISIVCTFIGHQPDRSRVRHDGLEFRAPCRRCKAPMIRGMAGWRLFDEIVDAPTTGLERKPRPDHS